MIKFNNSGQYILCCTSENFIVIIDSFKGSEVKI